MLGLAGLPSVVAVAPPFGLDGRRGAYQGRDDRHEVELSTDRGTLLIR